MPTGIGGEQGWWCPSLDTSGNGTLTVNDLASSNNLSINRGFIFDGDSNDTSDNINKWNTDTAFGGVRALAWDGFDDVAEGTLASSVASAPQVSISGWFRRSTTNSSGGFFGVGVNGSDSSRFAVQPRQDGRVYMTLEGTTYGWIASNDTNWHHFAAVFDGSASGNANRLKIYLDGSPASVSFFGTVPTSLGTPNLVRLGSSFAADAYPGSGRNDDVRIFSRAISATEVAHLASARGVQGAPASSDTTPPTVTSGVISTNGNTLTIGFSEVVTGTAGFTVASNQGAVTITYVSGSGSNAYQYSFSRSIRLGEAVTLAYSGTSIKDAANNNLAAFSPSTLTNNSTVPNPPTVTISLSPVAAIGQSITGTLTRSGGAFSSPLVIDMLSSNASVATVQSQVTIAASTASQTFSVAGVGVGVVTISAEEMDAEAFVSVYDPSQADEGNVMFTTEGLKIIGDGGLASLVIANAIYLRPYTNDLVQALDNDPSDLTLASLGSQSHNGQLTGANAGELFAANVSGNGVYNFVPITFVNNTASPVTLRGYAIKHESPGNDRVIETRKFPDSKILTPGSSISIVHAIVARNPI